jgi:hypothetical protein
LPVVRSAFVGADRFLFGRRADGTAAAGVNIGVTDRALHMAMDIDRIGRRVIAEGAGKLHRAHIIS